MARSQNTETGLHARPKTSMSSSEARENLPSLVKQARAISTPAESLAAHAVEIGPYNKGGVWLIPEVDAQAAIEREERLKAQIAKLEEELENLAIAEFVRDRVESASGRTMSGVEFVRALGFDDIADELESG
ncbi:MAG: hypothetical protein WBQ14_04345 [Gaiellaceae bacterium]